MVHLASAELGSKLDLLDALNRGLVPSHYLGTNARRPLKLMELIAQRSYAEQDDPIMYWRTKTHEEVDFILDRGTIAIEVKGSRRVDNRDVKVLRAFMEEHHPRKAFVVCLEARSRKTEDGIEIIPWKIFLSLLWKNAL